MSPGDGEAKEIEQPLLVDTLDEEPTNVLDNPNYRVVKELTAKEIAINPKKVLRVIVEVDESGETPEVHFNSKVYTTTDGVVLGIGLGDTPEEAAQQAYDKYLSQMKEGDEAVKAELRVEQVESEDIVHLDIAQSLSKETIPFKFYLGIIGPEEALKYDPKEVLLEENLTPDQGTQM
jgi:hypothetical protein